jgi:hypothetical protein
MKTENSELSGRVSVTSEHSPSRLFLGNVYFFRLLFVNVHILFDSK